MALRDISDRNAVLRAIEEFDAIGRDGFLHKYGYGPAIRFFVRHGGELYDSKAILGAAHGYQFGTPLEHDQFSGGAPTIRKLEELGFEVTGPNG